jgi:hypothetical protein
MTWQPPADQPDLGEKLFKKYHIRDADQLTSCSRCHR